MERQLRRTRHQTTCLCGRPGVSGAPLPPADFEGQSFSQPEWIKIDPSHMVRLCCFICSRTSRNQPQIWLLWPDVGEKCVPWCEARWRVSWAHLAVDADWTGQYWQVADDSSSSLTIATDDVPLGSYTMDIVIYHYRSREKFIPLGYASTQFSITGGLSLCHRGVKLKILFWFSLSSKKVLTFTLTSV